MLVKVQNHGEIQVEAGVSFIDAIKALDANLLNNAVAAKDVNGQIFDLRTNVENDTEISLVEIGSEDALHVLRHTTAHIMAEAVQNLFPEAKVTIGPATDNGFFYDFDFRPFTREDLDAIEKEMKSIIKKCPRIERRVVTRDEAHKFFEERGETYKLELIDAIAADKTITLYSQNNFTDLCTGPHILSTKLIKGFKLLSSSTAYWRANKDNATLSRIHGTAFFSKEDLDKYMEYLEDIKNRDHNKIGREMGLFTTVDVIGQGLPLLMPEGAKIIQTLQRWIEDTEDNEWGYTRTKTPLFAKSDLYKISGHWDHYKDGMFVLGNEEKVLKNPNLVALFIGIVLGVILGAIPIAVPGMSTPIKLGIAGGPVVVGILMGAFGSRIHLSTYTTRSANLMLRQMGIVIYLACLGLGAGGNFFSTVFCMQGLLWVGISLATALIPVLVCGYVASRWCGLDYAQNAGMLCAAMANPMALSYANSIVDDDEASEAYATVYPLSMFIRVISAQLLILLLA